MREQEKDLIEKAKNQLEFFNLKNRILLISRNINQFKKDNSVKTSKFLYILLSKTNKKCFRNIKVLKLKIQMWDPSCRDDETLS